MLTESFKCFTSAALVLIFALIDELHFSLSHFNIGTTGLPIFLALPFISLAPDWARNFRIPSMTHKMII